MSRSIPPFRIAVLLIVAVTTTVRADEKIDFFESRIRPVLIEHCYECHSADAKNVRGGLLLDSKAGTRDGGESGAAVVPGNPADSLLLSALKHESFEMPPDRKLPDRVVADFEKWIRDGAEDPRAGGKTITRTSIDLHEGRKFWSFQPISNVPPPPASDDRPMTDIDRFVVAKHREAGLKPNSDATPYEILRRLHFGLVGLPPSRHDIAAFIDDYETDPDGAIANVVDQLLASRHFGERWGRHWLDVTRFAESSGGGRSLMFPEAWRFRDYVIQSFNDDKPFDQLAREHIAGDLLPFETDQQRDDQVTGVGYLTLGPTNYEQQDKELLRMEVVDEQIDTLGRTFLGLTLGCARCHDHKFDPLPTADYYGMAGIFRSTQTLLPGNVSTYVTTSLNNGIDATALEKWTTTDKALKQQIAALKKQVPVSAATSLAAVNPDSLPGIVVDDVDARLAGDWTPSASVQAYVGKGYQHDANMKVDRRAAFETMLPQSGRYRVRYAYSSSSNRCDRVPIDVHHAGGMSTVTIDQRTRPGVDGLFADLGEFEFTADQPAVVSVNPEEAGNGVLIIDAVQFVPVELVAGDKVDPERAKHIQTLVAELRELEAKLKQHGRSKPKKPAAMGVKDEAEPGDWHIHVRGGIRNLGPVVPRTAVTVASPLNEQGEFQRLQIPDGSSGRLELADWVVSPENPLTARVFVNRVWLHLFGEGLVRTPDNFGKMGRPPTHPELLDYLAYTFVHEDHWSVKKLIRRIATSRVYRLASSPRQAGDPDNRLLTQGFRRRLDAESLRDFVLQISGQLDLDTTGGRTIERIAQYDNAYDHRKFSRTMRSVYVPFFRNSMLEIFSVFDVANPNLVTGRRASSTLPSQALYLLNSPFVLEQSELAAKHFLATESSDPATIDILIQKAYLATLSRPPSDAELRTLTSFVKSSSAEPQQAWTAVFQALFASVDFRYVD
ncbi:DUF1553 domain-containing protein [Fuerstiella marisgermanici]|uniref:Xanthan lyase n=1 Tax=Fuerstiella marisgermanici TaxID=1891926 RepID=A0A1P8WL36_9PLAN|nr:DUF1553 domain-containing protein [Fuerstiella marisgermanici]APZ94751.1 Xanthan lyase precursor [Fuerstiella marisgermanici]